MEKHDANQPVHRNKGEGEIRRQVQEGLKLRPQIVCNLLVPLEEQDLTVHAKPLGDQIQNVGPHLAKPGGQPAVVLLGRARPRLSCSGPEQIEERLFRIERIFSRAVRKSEYSFRRSSAAGPLQTGTKTEIAGPGPAPIGNPPKDGDKDWVALIKLKTSE